MRAERAVTVTMSRKDADKLADFLEDIDTDDCEPASDLHNRLREVLDEEDD